MAVSRHGRSTRAGVLIVTVLLIASFGLRLWDLNEPSVWHDEGWSIRAIRDPIGTPDDKTPLAYYSLIHLLWQGAGETPLALRYGSVLLDVLTVALAARLMCRWAGWDAAILATMLLGASPLLWAYAREIRAYVGVPLLTLVLLWQADMLLAQERLFRWRVWAGLLAAELAILYTHNLSVPVVAWLNLIIMGVWATRRRWRWLQIWLAGQAALLVMYLPWLFGQAPSGTPINSPPSAGLELAWNIWQGYFAPLPTLVGAKNVLQFGSTLFGALALLSVAALWAWRWDRRAWLLLSQAVMIPALVTVELIVASIDFHPRYFVASVPATLMLIALGVNSIPAEFESRWLAVPATIALAWGVSAASLVVLLDDPKYQHDDFRAVATHYAALPADAIILIPYGWEPAIEEYYAGKLNIQAEILGIDLHSDVETAMDEINAALAERDGPVHVELLTWFQLPADLRGMYPCLLESAGRRTEAPVYTVQGISSTGYLIERSLALAAVLGDEVDYGRVHLTGAALNGQQAVCVQTTWELPQTTGDDLRVSGRILTTDPPGWTLTRSDSDIRADDQTPTSMWKPGQRGAGFSLLCFPEGTPPGDYDIQLVVFSKSWMRGLDRLVSGIPSGKLLALATVQPQDTTVFAFSTQSDLAAVSADPRVTLVGHDVKRQTLSAGQELRITLRWHVADICCQVQPWTGAALTLRGDGWEVSQPVRAYASYSQDWHAFRIPAEARGEARLVLEADSMDPFLLAAYTVEETDRLFVRPAFDVPVQADFGTLAVLEGASVEQTTVSPEDTLGLTLVWRVLRTPGTSYRVFTHLLDADGRLIAQHDGYPVGETRLTTGWVPDEYIVDAYALVFDPERTDYRGPARLEVGFYDPETGDRVLAANGADHIILPIEITVQ